MSLDTKSLTPARRWLVHRMHQTVHGTMHNLVVQNGEPVIDPPPKIKQSVKLGSKRNALKSVSQNFLLKDQHVELFQIMEKTGNGVISKVVIQDGLPFSAEFDVG